MSSKVEISFDDLRKTAFTACAVGYRVLVGPSTANQVGRGRRSEVCTGNVVGYGSAAANVVGYGSAAAKPLLRSPW